MSVELTDKELAALYDDTICPDCGDGFAIRETLVPTVESIIQQRMAQAWNQGWTHGVGYSTGQTKTPFQNPYDPTEGNPA